MSSDSVSQPFVFTPGVSTPPASGTESLIHETRREIADIVREVAAAVRSNRTERQFLAFICDRTLRAMAAEGVVIWQRLDRESQRFSGVHRIGNVTDETIPVASVITHSNLISEVASGGQPVVVPATPGSEDCESAANPLEVPAALVPINCDPDLDAEYLLEVFLEPGCGVATQRGYLRFVAQMADLAGEFLRTERVRQLRRRQQMASKVDEAIEGLHRLESLAEVESAIVDDAAQVFGFDRVGLCAGEPVVLRAVSHVEQIDMRSSAAAQLREATNLQLDSDRCRWVVDSETPPPSDHDSERESPESHLQLRATVGGIANNDLRLICLQMSDAVPVPPEHRGELVRFTRHAELARRQASRVSAIPFGHWLAKISRKDGRRSLRRTLGLSLAAIATVTLLAFLPVPLTVHADAVLRPANSQLLTASRNAQVERVHVTHGQQVSEGQALITLLDPTLEEDIATLLGQRAVLDQERSQLTAEIVDTPTRQLDRLDQLQGQQKILAEQVRTLDAQLAVLTRIKHSLVLRAQLDGFVDAWQVEKRLQSRPLQRGDTLMQVIAHDSNWIADARVPQKRVGHIQHARSTKDFQAHVALLSQPNQSFPASIEQIGPALTAEQGSPARTAVLLRIDQASSDQVGSDEFSNHQSGAPVKVLFRCGTAPAAYCLFQDLYRSVRSRLALHGLLGDLSTGLPQ
ncbi:MAG: HlyD family efflux transporter periplasmic adaptor subunit [Rubripirellula sp.]